MRPITKVAWFGPNPSGGFPMPVTWQGWLLLVFYLALIAASVRLDGELAFLVRVGLSVAFVGFGYASYDSSG